MVHIEKMKASDGFFNEMGFDLEDIEQSVEELKLLPDPDFQKILRESMERSMQHVKTLEKQMEAVTLVDDKFGDLKENDGALF